MASKSDADNADLVQYARDRAAAGDDLYLLVGVDATTSPDDIHRAWRKRQLLLHPDKAGSLYDPAKLDALTRARDVLLSEPARQAYDGGMRAALAQRQRREQAHGRQRQLIDELERREEEARREKAEREEMDRQAEAERIRLAERGRRREEERARQVKEAEGRERLREESSAGVSAGDGKTAASSAATATATSAPAPGAEKEDHDERIAELERIIQENQARRAEKAARKAEKKARKSGVVRPSGTGDRADDATATQQREDVGDAPAPSTAHLDVSLETKAHEMVNKVPVFSFEPGPSSAAAPTREAASASNSPLKTVIADTVARLRARQAEIDAKARADALVAAT